MQRDLSPTSAAAIFSGVLGCSKVHTVLSRSLEKPGFLHHLKGSGVSPLKRGLCSPGPSTTAVQSFSALSHRASQGHASYVCLEAGQDDGNPQGAHCQPLFPARHSQQGRQIASPPGGMTLHAAGGRFTHPGVAKRETKAWVLKPLGSLGLLFATPKEN